MSETESTQAGQVRERTVKERLAKRVRMVVPDKHNQKLKTVMDLLIVQIQTVMELGIVSILR